MKNKQFIKLLKETKQKFSTTKYAKEQYQNQAKFIGMLLLREDYRAEIKRGMDGLLRLGLSAEAALLYLVGVWMATKGYLKAIEVNKREGSPKSSDAQG